jgi:hypothetical protein
VYLFFGESLRECRVSPQADGHVFLQAVLNGNGPFPLYVGKAKCLKDRLSTYATALAGPRRTPAKASAALRADRGEQHKLRVLREHARTCAVITGGTHFNACLLEILLIRTLRPPLNSASTSPSRTLFFSLSGHKLAISSTVPPLRSTVGFSSSRILVNETLGTLATVVRSLETGAALAPSANRSHRGKRKFSLREWTADPDRLAALASYFHGSPQG